MIRQAGTDPKNPFERRLPLTWTLSDQEKSTNAILSQTDHSIQNRVRIPYIQTHQFSFFVINLVNSQLDETVTVLGLWKLACSGMLSRTLQLFDIYNLLRGTALLRPTCMSLTMGNNSNTTHVAATNNHSKISCVKLDEINDLASLDLQHHSVMDSNEWVRIADGTTIMSNKVRDTLSTSGYTSHLTKLVLQNGNS